MVTYPELAKAERANERLRGVHLAQFLRRDAVAVLEPGRQAGERGLVPRGQAELARESPDLVLPQLGFDQGRAHAPVLRGLHARAVVAAVVHVGAVHEGATSFTLGDRRQLEEELFLAEEAPVRRIARVVRILELLGAHDQVPHAQQRAEPPGLVELAGRISLGVRGHQERARAERILGGARQQRGVDAARERDHDALHLAQHVQQAVVLGVRHVRARLG